MWQPKCVDCNEMYEEEFDEDLVKRSENTTNSETKTLANLV